MKPYKVKLWLDNPLRRRLGGYVLERSARSPLVGRVAGGGDAPGQSSGPLPPSGIAPVPFKPCKKVRCECSCPDKGRPCQTSPSAVYFLMATASAKTGPSALARMRGRSASHCSPIWLCAPQIAGVRAASAKAAANCCQSRGQSKKPRGAPKLEARARPAPVPLSRSPPRRGTRFQCRHHPTRACGGRTPLPSIRICRDSPRRWKAKRAWDEAGELPLAAEPLFQKAQPLS